MNPKHQKQLYERVEIQYVNLEEASTELATVLVRDGEMVIDIQNPEDHTPAYLIVGKSIDYFFQGHNSASGDVSKVLATWTRLGGSYIGEWSEGGIDYLFSFELED